MAVRSGGAVLCIALVFVAACSGRSAGPRTNAATRDAQTASTSATGGARDLVVESGFSTQVNNFGQHWSSAGALVSNPNSGLAAFDVTVAFDIIDGRGAVAETETSRISYLAPGAAAPAAPYVIRTVFAAPSAVRVTASARFAPDDGGLRASAGRIVIVSTGLGPDEFHPGTLQVNGQVSNPTAQAVQFAPVTCIERSGGSIIGGQSTTISDTIPPGTTIAFQVNDVDVGIRPSADTALCISDE